jgi:hypothetical protein
MAKPIPSVISEEIKARFWAKVDIRGADECWPWLSVSRQGGRGVFTIDRNPHSAPRVAWSIANGVAIPENQHACHSCDNPPCVNPAHIWPGTQADNIQDCVAKGRHGSKKKDFCKRGHALTDSNRRPIRRGGSHCAACAKEQTRERMRKFRSGRPETPLSERRRKAWKTRREKYGVSGCSAAAIRKLGGGDA